MRYTGTCVSETSIVMLYMNLRFTYLLTVDFH